MIQAYCLDSQACHLVGDSCIVLQVGSCLVVESYFVVVVQEIVVAVVVDILVEVAVSENFVDLHIVEFDLKKINTLLYSHITWVNCDSP